MAMAWLTGVALQRRRVRFGGRPAVQQFHVEEAELEARRVRPQLHRDSLRVCCPCVLSVCALCALCVCVLWCAVCVWVLVWMCVFFGLESRSVCALKARRNCP